MNLKGGKIAVAACVLCALGILTAWALKPGGARAALQAVPDLGKFKTGSELGLERAGFSGRDMVFVFVNPEAADYPQLASCLESPEIQSEMAFFTGILIDERLEPKVEAILRAGQGFGMVARGLNGVYLGGLKKGFQCPELLDLLRSIRQGASREPEKSPIYAALLQSAAPVDALIEDGFRQKAERFVSLLKEFEGESSPAVMAAESRLKAQ